jgi:exodeoxyribonuclease-3
MPTSTALPTGMADVHDGAVLQVGARADAHVVDVPAHHGARPQRAVLADLHVADHARIGVDVGARADLRRDAAKGSEDGHAWILAGAWRGDARLPCALAARAASGYRMKIASWNVNSLNVRMPHLQQWLATAAPDVVGLQETKLEDAKFPCAVLEAGGYASVFSGQKTYNGVAVLARGRTIADVQCGIPGFEDDQRRVIAATVDGIRIANLYVVNGQAVGSDKFAYKLRWLRAVRDWLAAERARHPRLVVVGDFNIAPDARDVHDAGQWHGQHILSSDEERAALQAILDLGFHDAFRLVSGEPGVFSWWDYRQAAFRRNLGLRIDLTLVSDALRDSVAGAGIDREPRTWDRPSDHAPAWVELRT